MTSVIVRRLGYLKQNNIEGGSFISWFIKGSWIVAIGAAALQLVFWSSPANLFAVVCALFAWKLTEAYLLRFNRLRRFALSSFLILGFSITQYLLPLVFTLLEGKPLVYNLNLPYDVFIHSLLALLILIFSHSIYAYSQKGHSLVRQRIQQTLFRFSFFTPPSNRQIWIMGFLGLLSMFYVYFVSRIDENGEGGNKLLQGLMPFSYLPFFIPLKSLIDPSYKYNKKKLYQLILYTILLFVVSLGRNSRSSFMLGFTTIGLGYFLGLMLGKFNYKILTPKSIIISGIIFWVVTGPLSDLGIAMVVERTHRGQISSGELLVRTITTFQDKEALKNYKVAATEKFKSTDWDERYFDNIFLSRFCNLKYNDASLEQAYKLGKIDPLMQKYAIDKTLATFPQPVLTFFNIGIDKQAISVGSFGDYLFYRASGTTFGGFRTGQFAGVGLASFGWWYLLILGVGMGIIYFLHDLFLVYRKNGFNSYISLAGLTSITSTFMFLSLSSNSQSVTNLFSYILRGWLQLVILYLVVYFIARKIDAGLKKINS
ncbi:MAG: hypothetical protein ACTHMV_02020 [Chitinophagaceae bacterium]